jgi:hypothetical protein
MEWLRSLLARWKVQVSIVAGALVVATAYGTCTLRAPGRRGQRKCARRRNSGGDHDSRGFRH